MKLPSHLAKSRHGIFYFRWTFTANGRVSEKRFSLSTRNPSVAKQMAMYIAFLMMGTRMTKPYDPSRFNKDDPRTWPGDEDGVLNPEDAVERVLRQLKKEWLQSHSSDLGQNSQPIDLDDSIFEKVKELQIQVGNTTLIADPKDPADLRAALQLAKELGAHAQALKPQEFEISKQTSKSEDEPKVSYGFTLDEMIGRYLARSKSKLAPKTHYEYERMLKKFETWLYAKKSSNPYMVRSITRVDIGDFIDDLMDEGLTASVIQKKYLAVLNGVFGLAQTLSAIPSGDLPTRGHKIFTKRDQKKSHHKNGFKPFSEDELIQVFDHEKLLGLEQPADFWLPLLGLHTGARISELTQLLITDIKKVGDIWTIDINDEAHHVRKTSKKKLAAEDKAHNELGKSVKTVASVRQIPLHPTLIKIGFLDYVELVKPYRGDLFPYLNADSFGSKSGRPSERFGKYLDGLSITSKNKVFHSFRSTANDLLKQAGVSEEARCQFVGHEHDTVNSSVYSKLHSVEFLLTNVADKLVFPKLKFETLKAPLTMQKDALAHLVGISQKRMLHEQKRKDRLTRLEKEKSKAS